MLWPPPADWPLSQHSVKRMCKPHRWHVQSLGAGPELLLIHGAGGATHSWRGLAPLLAPRYRLHLVDLPGHGYTRSPYAARSGLAAMSADLTALATQEGWRPRAILAHSAGAAVALRMARHDSAPPMVIGINPALAPFDGVAGWLFPLMAKLMALNPFIPALVTRGANAEKARKLIEGTGSVLDAEGYALYARLLGDRAHVNGTLQMMARWDLGPLLRELPQITTPVRFVTGLRDRAVAPEVAETAAARLPDARVIHLEGLGHLAHEEDPERVAEIVFNLLPETDAAAHDAAGGAGPGA